MRIWERIFSRPVEARTPGLAPERLPQHVAIIMDGNGRWAKRRGLPRSAGHRSGFDRVEDVLQTAIDCGIKYLTLYAFSTENWKRSAEEVEFLMNLFREAMTRYTDRLRERGVALQFIGRRDRLPANLRARMEELEGTRLENPALTMTLAIDYGSREEILSAARVLARRAMRGELEPDAMAEDDLRAALYTRDLPDPDLIIRPSGEYRLSNFLLWQGAYAELWFSPVLWPDFGREQLLEALHAYARRERRFGRA